MGILLTTQSWVYCRQSCVAKSKFKLSFNEEYVIWPKKAFCHSIVWKLYGMIRIPGDTVLKIETWPSVQNDNDCLLNSNLLPFKRNGIDEHIITVNGGRTCMSYFCMNRFMTQIIVIMCYINVVLNLGSNMSISSSWYANVAFYKLWIWVWKSNCIHYKVWDEITCPFPNFNGATVDVWEWTSNFT